MIKSLVTGGAGFIGSHVVDSLIAEGHEVMVLDDLSSGSLSNINSEARFIGKPICEDLREIFEREKFDYVFHLAAQIALRYSLENPKKDAETNIVGSLNVIENCVNYNVEKIIFASTGGAIYSPNSCLPWTEKSSANPQSPYGLTKLTVEKYLKMMNQLNGLKSVSLRYSNVYGPRQDSKGEAGVVSIFMNNLLKKEEMTIFGDGHQTRDFVYVKDVALANILALDLEGVFNVGVGEETSINELERKMRIATSNFNTLRFYKGEIKGELERSCLYCNKIKKRGWKPEYDLDKGLEETVEWFRERLS